MEVTEGTRAPETRMQMEGGSYLVPLVVDSGRKPTCAQGSS